MRWKRSIQASKIGFIKEKYVDLVLQEEMKIWHIDRSEMVIMVTTVLAAFDIFAYIIYNSANPCKFRKSRSMHLLLIQPFFL